MRSAVTTGGTVPPATTQSPRSCQPLAMVPTLAYVNTFLKPANVGANVIARLSVSVEPATIRVLPPIDSSHWLLRNVVTLPNAAEDQAVPLSSSSSSRFALSFLKPH